MSGAEDDGKMPYYTHAAACSNIYAYAAKNWGGGYSLLPFVQPGVRDGWYVGMASQSATVQEMDSQVRYTIAGAHLTLIMIATLLIQ